MAQLRRRLGTEPSPAGNAGGGPNQRPTYVQKLASPTTRRKPFTAHKQNLDAFTLRSCTNSCSRRTSNEYSCLSDCVLVRQTFDCGILSSTSAYEVPRCQLIFTGADICIAYILIELPIRQHSTMI